jgi:phage terminase large subunit
VLHGQAVYFSASERQTKSQLKANLERLVARIDELPDDPAVYNYGITFPEGGAILLASAADVNAMQGHHGETLCIVADEAQHLDDDQLVALQSCVVADSNWLVLTGNALNLGGPFHRVATSADPSWHRTKVTALEVIDDAEAMHIRGLVTKKGVDNIRQTWGQDSAHFQSRVLANFPAQPADALFPEPAIQRAFALWSDPNFIQAQRQEDLTLGVDVGASEEGDASVMAFAFGGWVQELITWHEADTMRSVSRIISEFRRLRIAKVRGSPFHEREAALLQDHIGSVFVEAAFLRGDPLDYDGFDADIYVDEIGVGRGVADRLRELNYSVKPFNASKRATTEARQFTYANLRAEAYARMRDKMIRGEVGLPYSPELEQELRTARGFLNNNDKLQVIAKDDWRQIIHRSPDRLDAVVMAVAARWYASFGSDGQTDGPIAF